MACLQICFYTAGVLENMEQVTEMNAATTERSKPLRQSGAVSKPLRRPAEAAVASAVDEDDAVDGGEEKIDDSVDTEADGVTEGTNAVIKIAETNFWKL